MVDPRPASVAGVARVALPVVGLPMLVGVQVAAEILPVAVASGVVVYLLFALSVVAARVAHRATPASRHLRRAKLTPISTATGGRSRR